MKTAKAKFAKQIEWDKSHTRQIRAKLNENTDADIIKHLDNIDNIAGYLKKLIREDIAKGGK